MTDTLVVIECTHKGLMINYDVLIWVNRDMSIIDVPIMILN